MKNILVGSTGFVGGNLLRFGDFQAAFHSTDVGEAYGSRPDLLVYAGVRAAKFLANHDAEADLCEVMRAAENISRIAPKKLVLISTVDVFKDTRGRDETAMIDTEGLHPYGLNRYRLECAVRELYPEALIVRLPALYGQGLKKNFIFDMLTLVPSMLTAAKYEELSASSELVREAYAARGDSFFACRYGRDAAEFLPLREELVRLGFTSLLFTDSRARYQFYDLARLWGDICLALSEGLRLLHPATEPVSAAEVYRCVFGREFKNELSRPFASYDYRTRYAELFGGADGYIERRVAVLAGLKKFAEGWK